jgi:hypothetical protein
MSSHCRKSVPYMCCHGHKELVSHESTEHRDLSTPGRLRRTRLEELTCQHCQVDKEGGRDGEEDFRTDSLKLEN